jgi:hypothetical protein
MTRNLQVLRLRARCPECGSPPRLRTVPQAVSLFRAVPPETVIITYQCHAPRCNVVFPIRAGDFTEKA